MKNRQKLRKGIILISFFLFPAIFYYLSPVIIIQSTLNGIINGSFIMFLLMFISALIFGRAYCGWVCPGAGCQEAIFPARNKRVTSLRALSRPFGFRSTKVRLHKQCILVRSQRKGLLLRKCMRSSKEMAVRELVNITKYI